MILHLPFLPAHLQSIPEPKASAQAGAGLPGKELFSAHKLHRLTALRKLRLITARTRKKVRSWLQLIEQANPRTRCRFQFGQHHLSRNFLEVKFQSFGLSPPGQKKYSQWRSPEPCSTSGVAPCCSFARKVKSIRMSFHCLQKESSN